jgi:hypothetical protein
MVGVAQRGVFIEICSPIAAASAIAALEYER